MFAVIDKTSGLTLYVIMIILIQFLLLMVANSTIVHSHELTTLLKGHMFA